jgi:hypothetical protein
MTSYSRIYKHLFVRVGYPREGGYRTEATDVPNWMHLEIIEKGTSKRLWVHSRIHMNKKSTIGPQYSSEFTDQEILKDLSGEIFHRYID